MKANPKLEEVNSEMPLGVQSSTWSFRLEMLIGAFLFAAVILWGIWPVLGVPNNTYPYTTDGMGHLTRIVYIADNLRAGKWASWFPFWYNGCTVTQYYPPLSFMLFAIVQVFTHNIMLTFKIMVFAAQFIGAVGTWYLCRRLIGPWTGIIGGALYAIQPFLLRSELCGGEIAQIPIFALTPWFLYLTLKLFEEKTRFRWLMVCILGVLLILSQSMHAFLISICIGVMMLVMLVSRRKVFRQCIFWVIALALGTGLGSFWILPGVTQLENPGVPYLLPEASSVYAAMTSFFTLAGRSGSGFYIGVSMLVLALFSIAYYRKNKSILPLLIVMLVATYLSFGEVLPLYKYIPMHQSFVPRRFLSFAILAAAILDVYVLNELIFRKRRSHMLRIACFSIGLLIIIVLAVDVNPRVMDASTNRFSEYRQELDMVSHTREPFKQGRFTWLYPDSSQVAYFPMLKGLNMADGWSIEGTPHNRAIWQHNIAIAEHCDDYIIKNLLYWNTRSAFIDNRWKNVIKGLKEQGFQAVKEDNKKTILFNPQPSSYFMRQERDALVIGKAAINLEMNFPWLVRGYSNRLEDYTPEYLKRFKLIYLIEPEVKDFTQFQNIVENLAEEDKIIIVSMGRGETWPLLDIIPYWEKIETDSDLKPTGKGPIKGEARLEADPTGQVPALGNVDILWAVMQGSDKKVPAIGYKEVNGHKVYFVGLALGQQLNMTHGEQIKAILEQLMDIAHPNKNIIPAAFPVQSQEWKHDGFNFIYNSTQIAPIQIAVTYTPRWKAKVDGKPWPIYNMDHLIYMELPEGAHKVDFHYGMTWVGWLGIALSIFSLLLVAIFYFCFDYFDRMFDSIKANARKSIISIGE